jgi:Kunitz/Bovine pancreatic trypsin inhibitor domain
MPSTAAWVESCERASRRWYAKGMKTSDSWLALHAFLPPFNWHAASLHLVAVLTATSAGCGGREVGGTAAEEPPDAASDAAVADCGATGSPGTACSLPYDPGPCNAFFPVFAFVNGKCTKEIYGGCGGNGNRFSSLAECLGQCQRTASCGCPDGRVLRQICVACGMAGGCTRFADSCEKTCITNSDCSDDMGICSDRVCSTVVCR